MQNKIVKICTTSDLEGLKRALARYWFTTADALELHESGSVSESGNLKKGVHWQKHRGGFMAYHEAKAKI